MTPKGRVGSVLIPAHNESAVIARCLNSLFHGIDASELEVAVVCNGCQDDTVAVVRNSGHLVEVIDLAIPSKTAALRAGDQLLHTFPRLYLDADVVLPGPVAIRVLQHLSHTGSTAARPPFRYETSHSSAIVRRYYRARSRIPAVMGSIWGAGVYGLSETGRARFGDYPDVVADDLFVDQFFRRDEIDIVGDEPVVVMAPAHFRDLLKVMRRAYRGAAESMGTSSHSASAPTASNPTTAGTMRDVLRLCRTPSGIIDAATYALVAITARIYVTLGRTTVWERDESSRSMTSNRSDSGSVH
ncbi:glycosyltransferase [Mycolicibacterium smegmatis]|uniref:glycosyltransferase n=1 Tax=Mycolicibacterium smegmatis TaxID=1772 RepID=UPI0009B7AD89|nr:glycosyltransferase family 2 protein [Mycolicibacterium smegmatis]